MEAARLAKIAYMTIMKEIYTIQERMVKRKLMKEMFGDQFIDPMTEIVGIRAPYFERQRKGENVDWDKSDRERLDELYMTIAAMEPVFAEREEAELDAFAAAMKEMFRNK